MTAPIPPRLSAAAWLWLAAFFLGAQVCLGAAERPPMTGPTVAGDRVKMVGDIACAPANAPEAVKRAIWATNFIVRKSYVWGGGHGTFYDRGYDCSGTISFFLHHGGLLKTPASSKELLGYGEPGCGRWITIYARSGHVFAVIAGMRLDTTGGRAEEGPRWRRNDRSPRGYTARHPRGF